MDQKKFNKLIRKIRNPKICNKLYSYYFPKIVSHIYYKFRNENLGEDVAQEFFTKLLHKEITTYVEHPTAWVYVACDNIAKDFLANEKSYNLAYTEEGISEDQSFEFLLYGEYVNQIKKLDEQTQKIIQLHFYEGYSLKEIAALLNLNYNTVRQKCSRGLKKLHNLET